ncbi:MAG: Y-family DNA polymerase [Candidatus Saccharimonadales bacterium]
MSKRKPVFALVDCNNFFVSCERVFRPDLWDKPVAVLSNNDGCIVARSNEVKALGVPMGIPYFKVRDVLTRANVTLFSGNFRLYGDFSQRIVQILRHECPDVEVYSVDESFLELSSLPIDDYEEWAHDLRAQIMQWTGIPVSIGVASSKTLAKAAADFAKKNDEAQGGFSIAPDAALSPEAADQKRVELLKWLPVGDIWGIGRRLAPKMQARGISTAYDLSLVSDTWARSQLSIRGVKLVRELKGESCLGLTYSDEPQQSIARTRSFGHSVRDYYELESAIATFTAQAAAKLRDQEEVAGAILTFLRTSKHAEVQGGGSQVVTLLPPSADTGTLITAALQGLEQVYDPDFGYKKGGVILLDLHPATAQQLTFESKPEQMEQKERLMRTVDEMNARYGTRLVRHASEHTTRHGWRSKRERVSHAYTTEWTELPLVHA